MNQQQLVSTLQAAFTGDQSAIQRLDEYANHSYGECVLGMATLASTPPADNNLQICQSAALYLKNTIAAVDSQTLQQKHERWKKLDAGTRTQVKDLLVQQGIARQHQQVAHTVAICVAHIASVELPFQEWPQLVPQLSQWVVDGNSSNSGNAAIATTSLECLGFIADYMGNVQDVLDVPEMEELAVNSMLTAIVSGTQATHQPITRKAGLQALKHALQFVRPNMEKQAERNVIIQCMCEGVTAEQPELRALAYSCIEEACELYYHVMSGDYLKAFFDLTMATLGRKENEEDPNVKMAAIEVWTVLSASESAMAEAHPAGAPGGSQNYVQAAAGQLVPHLLNTLLQQEEDADDEEWNLQAAGAVCLEYVALCVGGTVLETVMPFVTSNIVQGDWRLKDAATVAFMCVLDGPGSQALGRYIIEAVPILLGLCNDPHDMVRDSAVHCVGKICQLHMPVLLDNHQNAQSVVHGLIQSLIAKLQDLPRIAAHACTALFNLAQSMRSDDEPPPTSVLTEPMLPLLQGLMATAERSDADERNLRTSSLSAAAELVASAPADTAGIFLELMPAVLAKLEAGLLQSNNSSPEAQMQVVGGLINMVTSLVARMEVDQLANHCDRLVQLLLQSFTTVPIVAEETLMAFGNLAGKLDHNFTKYVNSFMPHLKTAVDNFSAQSLCAVALGVVVDVAGASVDAQVFQPHCDDLMQILFRLLKDEHANRDLKPLVFSAFGDVCLALGGGFAPYLNMSTMMLLQASQSSMPTPNSDGTVDAEDEELVLYITNLRRAILEAYSGIIIGVSDGQIQDAFLPTVPNILSFLQYIQAPDQGPLDPDVHVQAVTTLGDVAQSMGNYPIVKQALQEQQAHLVTLVQGCADIDAGIHQWAMGELQKIFS